MTNSYSLTFGEPIGKCSDELVELASEIFSQFEFDGNITKEQSNIESFKELVAKVPPLNRNEKAHILDMSFHNANENFYELEDDGTIDDASALQEDFLKQVVQALS